MASSTPAHEPPTDPALSSLTQETTVRGLASAVQRQFQEMENKFESKFDELKQLLQQLLANQPAVTQSQSPAPDPVPTLSSQVPAKTVPKTSADIAPSSLPGPRNEEGTLQLYGPIKPAFYRCEENSALFE